MDGSIHTKEAQHVTVRVPLAEQTQPAAALAENCMEASDERISDHGRGLIDSIRLAPQSVLLNSVLARAPVLTSIRPSIQRERAKLDPQSLSPTPPLPPSPTSSASRPSIRPLGELAEKPLQVVD